MLLNLFQIFILTALYSLAYAYKRLVRNGVSKIARWAFFKKHLVYVVVISIVWIFQLITNYFRIYYSLYYQNKEQEFSQASETSSDDRITDKFHSYNSINTVSQVTMFGTGLLLSFVRILDPYYRQVIRMSFLSYFGIVSDPPEQGIQSKPLNSYLAESLNVELINIILQAITLFREPCFDTILENLGFN